jgi:hypothetical protein
MSNTTNTTSTETYDFVLYRYHPNLVAPIIFTVLFFATTFIHAFQLGRSRTWYFIPMVVGGLSKFPAVPRYVSPDIPDSPQWKQSATSGE